MLQTETKTSTPIETAFVDGETLDAVVGPVGVTEYETETAETETERDEGMRTRVTEDDEEKPVVAPEGDPVGMIEEVSGGKAYVDPEPGLVDRIRSKLGWGTSDEEDYTLDEENIERITDDEVELSVPK